MTGASTTKQVPASPSVPGYTLPNRACRRRISNAELIASKTQRTFCSRAFSCQLVDTNRSTAHNAERDGIKRLESHYGNAITELSVLWEEQETGISRETKLLKAVDRLLPFLHNINSDGRTWQESSVKKSQVANAHAFIANDFPEIHAWMVDNLNIAVQKGWLIDA